jgi:gluconokinase
MMADIFAHDVYVPESVESSCLGACILALYGLGMVDSLHVVSDMVGATYHHEPIQENVKVYHELLPIYVRLSRLLTEEYDHIAAFQAKWIGK